MTYTKIFLYCLMLCVLGIAGCTSNTSTESGFGTGNGFNINLRATQTILQQGGQTTLFASVKDGQGNPVNDTVQGVRFTSTQGAVITADKTINLGVCSATYTAPGAGSTTQPNTVVDQVTASYQGAFAFISIQVSKP